MTKEFTVNTGFGYFEDAEGKIIAKCELKPGKHPIKKDFKFVEVGSKEDLDSIEIAPPLLSDEQIREQKIQAEMRRIAEESLIARGEL